MSWLPRFIGSAGGRKFLFVVVVLVLSSAALYIDKINGGQWVDLLKWVGGSFMVSAAAEGVAGRLNGKPPKPKTP